MEDIGPILRRWPYVPGEVTVRKVIGRDGKARVQLRLDLGLLQMELTGRPDGQRPYGADSVLDHHRERLADHRRRRGTDAGFSLTPDECAELRDESVMYYHRYLTLYHLEEFEGVVADTSRNLECLDFLRAYAAEEGDRVAFEQYRPYIIMMRARAQAALALKDESFDDALAALNEAIREIEVFFRAMERPELVQESVEIASLRRLAAEIRRRLPATPAEALKKELQHAVEAEEFERAAILRDQLRQLETEQ